MKYLFLLCFIAFNNAYSQSKNGNLLLLRVEKTSDLKIDQLKVSYYALELDSAYVPNGQLSKPIFFQGFTDQHLLSCQSSDSIRLKSFFTNDTFENDLKSLRNDKMINEQIRNMHFLLKSEIKSLVYDRTIKISYLLISSEYCIGQIAKYDGKLLGYDGEIILVTDRLKINPTFKIPEILKFDILRKIDYNNLIW